MTTTTKRSVLHVKISKFVRKAISVSFAPSAGYFCPLSCRFLANRECYAARLERIYPALRKKLLKNHRAGPISVATRATTEIASDDTPLVWARTAVNGDLPRRKHFETAADWRIWGGVFRGLIRAGLRRGAIWQIFASTYEAARSYRAICKDLPVVIRRSSQARSISELLQSSDPRVWVVSKGATHSGCVTKRVRAANEAECHVVAKQIRDSGQLPLVCPSPRLLCGQCKGCAMVRPDGTGNGWRAVFDVILIPFHG